jgi:hypothetical protein
LGVITLSILSQKKHHYGAATCENLVLRQEGNTFSACHSSVVG